MKYHNPGRIPTDGEKIVEQITDALKAFRKLPEKKRGDLYVELQCAIYSSRNKLVRRIVEEIIDVMHIELYGYSKLHNFQTIKHKRQTEKSGAASVETSDIIWIQTSGAESLEVSK